MKKLIFLLLMIPMAGFTQQLNYITYSKENDSISIGYDVNGRDTSINIAKSDCQAYQSAVQVFRMDTLSNVLAQIDKSMTLGEPERILAYGQHGSLTIINMVNLPEQAKAIFEGFKNEVLQLIMQ